MCGHCKVLHAQDVGALEFQTNLNIFVVFLMVTLCIWLPSQFLKRNSGAALRAVTNDECPVRFN